MATKVGPNSIIDGLVLEVDPLSIKSYPQQRNMLVKTDTPFNDGRLPSGNYNNINLYTATRSIYSENYYSWSSINGNTPLFSVTNNQPYTFSFYLDPVDTTYLTIKILGAGGEQIAISNISPSVIGRYSVTLTPNTSVTNYAQIYIGSSNGTQIKIGGIQLEVGSIASDYISVPFTKTTIADLSEYVNNATINSSPEFLNGSFDMAGSKNITTNSNTLNGLPDLSSSFSVSVWYKHSSFSGYTAFFEKQSGFTQRLDMGSYIGQTQYFTTWYSGYGTYDVAAGFVPVINTWYNTVLTASPTIVRGYINGVEIVSQNVSGSSWPDLNHVVAIGGNNRKFNGSIGLTQVYNKTLSALEVLQNFNALRGRYGI